MDVVIWIQIAVFSIGLPIAVFFHHRSLVQEISRNSRMESPDDAQVRWHIQHIRSDVALIVYLLGGILAALLWIGSKL